MSSSPSVNYVQGIVEQLKLEAGVERIKTLLSCAVGGVVAELFYGCLAECTPGLSGSCRASAVLYAERLQRCFACWRSGWKQPISRAQVLLLALKTGKVF